MCARHISGRYHSESTNVMCVERAGFLHRSLLCSVSRRSRAYVSYCKVFVFLSAPLHNTDYYLFI